MTTFYTIMSILKAHVSGQKYYLFTTRQTCRLVGIESICRQQTKCNPKVETYFEKGKKTLCENEKMLVTSIFSFSHNVFKGLSLLKVGINRKYKTCRDRVQGKIRVHVINGHKQYKGKLHEQTTKFRMFQN